MIPSALAVSPTIRHSHDVRPILKRLLKVADIASDVFVARDCEWNYRL